VDDFTLGVLFVTERDDRGFAPTRVGTEFRVDVSLDNLGDGLGLCLYKVKFSGRKKKRGKVSLKIWIDFFLNISFRRHGRGKSREKR
jgi:hypothetical protein